MELVWQQAVEMLSAIGQYIKLNSIDFISMVASILIAIETNKWIEKRTERKEKRHLVGDLLSEIDMIRDELEQDENNERDNIEAEKLTLKIMPYNLPVWNSIKNTSKINLLTESKGYKDILAFYSEICELNEWESTLTYYVLFIQHNKENMEKDEFYRELLVEQVSEQRKEVILLADVARRSLEEG